MAAAFAGAPAKAETAAEARIEAIFALVLEQPQQSTEAFARHVSLRRAEERVAGLAALPLAGTGPELAMFQVRPPEDPTVPLFAEQPGAADAAPEGPIVPARLPRARPQPPEYAMYTGSIAPTETIAPAEADEGEFFSRFVGAFNGSGEVKRTARSSARQVECTLTGSPTANGIRIAGECGASIFSREISAEIAIDPSGAYTGTYIGSAAGPARLWGQRRGDDVVLTITWPKVINGDTKATMTIHNSGNGTLAISVVDAVSPGGPQAEVTRLTLAQI